ncbi:transcription antitermination factor NusB, partial [Actinocorallia lasiicapitis]
MAENRRRASAHRNRGQQDNRRPARQAQRRPPGDAVRRVAYDVLRAVDSRDAYANLLLPRMLRDKGMSGRDAALATELTYGTLRGLGTYDAILNLCSDRPVEKIDPPLRDLLRLGTHQLLRTRIPSHAAVSTTVDLVRSVAGPGQSKFANAVLRKVASRDLPSWLVIIAPTDDELGRLSITHSHPRWIVSALRDAVGPDEIEDLLAADNERPGVTLVARPGRSTVEDLLALGAGPAAYSPYAAYLPEGDPGELSLVRNGHAGVQDEGSQLVALALAEAPVEGDDGLWLDLCAGPGG